ncbi:hypothetical protein O3M35_005386 [Rhynocoris fuscipes]|uniref:Uncharacterized protein n=1 Tax=Rhynocoris fuscipes TaxID=488301 RepID=A0AAW1DI32_9HEMI
MVGMWGEESERRRARSGDMLYRRCTVNELYSTLNVIHARLSENVINVKTYVVTQDDSLLSLSVDSLWLYKDSKLAEKNVDSMWPNLD